MTARAAGSAGSLSGRRKLRAAPGRNRGSFKKSTSPPCRCTSSVSALALDTGQRLIRGSR